MKNITIFLPDNYLIAFEYLVKKGHIGSRSDGVRMALRDLLSKDNNFMENVKEIKKFN